MAMYIYKNKQQAIKKLNQTFHKEIIVNVQKIGRDHVIETLWQKEHYKNSVYTQSEELWQKYLDHLLQEFEVKTMAEEKAEQIKDIDKNTK